MHSIETIHSRNSFQILHDRLELVGCWKQNRVWCMSLKKASEEFHLNHWSQWNLNENLDKLTLVIGDWGTCICCEISLRRMSVDFTDDTSTLVLVTAWCRQATGHYLSQCWPRWMSPYGITRPRGVKRRIPHGLFDVLTKQIAFMIDHHQTWYMICASGY